jgi:hypothetical protein
MPWGVQIHDMVAVGGQGGAGATSSSSKGKEKEVSTGPVPKACSWSPSSNAEGSTNQSALQERKRGHSTAMGPMSGGPISGATGPK